MSHSELFVLLNSVTDPIYVQLIDQVRRYVASGRLTAGQPLPSVRELGQKLGVNPMTVSKAYRLLEAESILVSQRGIGLVIGVGQTAMPHVKHRIEILRPTANRLVFEAGQLDVAQPGVIALVRQIFDSADGP